jgi:tRNA(fMet)-specific endonuclease VapC
MRYMLDTNILIALSKARPGLAEKLAGYPANAILLSSVVVAEIENGIAKSACQEHNRRVSDALLSGFGIAKFRHCRPPVNTGRFARNWNGKAN